MAKRAAIGGVMELDHPRFQALSGNSFHKRFESLAMRETAESGVEVGREGGAERDHHLIAGTNARDAALDEVDTGAAARQRHKAACRLRLRNVGDALPILALKAKAGSRPPIIIGIAESAVDRGIENSRRL